MIMTVQDLINELNNVEDKTLPCIVCNYAEDHICGDAIWDCIELDDRVSLELYIQN